MAQRRDQLNRRALTRRSDRAWARVSGIALGFGYQPWRALIGLAGTILAAVVLTVVAGDRGGLTPVDPTSISCSIIDKV